MLTTDEMCATVDRAKARIEELEATAATMLHALKYARNHVLNPKNTDTDDLLNAIHAAWDQATAAGIEGGRRDDCCRGLAPVSECACAGFGFSEEP